MASRGLLPVAALTGLACLGLAAPATASFFAAPGIHSFSPAHGAADTRVTITGSGFARVTAVRFRGVAAAFKVRSASKITAVVPAMPSGAGRITVTARAGTATSRARFTVTPRVKLSLGTGPPGSVVRVSGTGFRASGRVDIFVGTAAAALASASRAGSFGPVAVTIPASALPGTAWISAKGRRSRLFAQAAFTVNTNWAQFRFSYTHSGFNPYENVLSVSDVTRLRPDWSFPAKHFGPSDPAVANGIVYIMADGSVDALNAATGTRRWRFRIGPPDVRFASSPAVANGVVYAGTDGGYVFALNAKTGTKRWQFQADGLVLGFSVAVANGVVYGSDDATLYALNAATGAKLWSFTDGNYLTTATVANGTVYVGSYKRVYALNAATGTKLWAFTTGDAVASTPAVANGVVYVGSYDDNVYAINAATGTKLWAFTTGNGVVSSPAVANGVVYIGSLDGKVYALDAATGTKLWAFTTGNTVASSPAVANGVVYIGSFDGNLYALNAATGTKLWTFRAGGAVNGSPAVANGMLYVTAGQSFRSLHAFRLSAPSD